MCFSSDMVYWSKRKLLGLALSAVFSRLAVGDSHAEGANTPNVDKKTPKLGDVEIVSERHDHYAEATYVRSLITKKKLDSDSVYMIESGLPVNGILDAFYDDKITQAQLAKFFRGYAFEQLSHTAENRAQTIADLKAAGVKTFAYDPKPSMWAVLSEENTNDFLQRNIKNNISKYKKGTDGAIKALEEIYDTKRKSDSEFVSSAELQTVINRIDFKYFPKLIGLPNDGAINLKQMLSLIKTVEERQDGRLKDMDETVDLLSRYGAKSEQANFLDGRIRDITAQNNGRVSVDDLGAAIIHAIVRLGEYSKDIIVQAGENHVNGSLVHESLGVIADGGLDETLKAFGYDVRINSVRDEIAGYETSGDKRFIPDCTNNTNFTSYTIIDRKTGKQTVYYDRDVIKAEYEIQYGSASDRWADYCNTMEGKLPAPTVK